MVEAGYLTLRKNRISEIETGKRKVSVGEAFAFADVLGVFFEDLVRTAEDLAYAEWWRLQHKVWLANARFLLGPFDWVDALQANDPEGLQNLHDRRDRVTAAYRRAIAGR